MRKPNNFENVQAQGEFTPIELGGHKLIIKQVEERMSKTNKPMAEYRAKWYGESEEDAAKNLPEQNQVME